MMLDMLDHHELRDERMLDFARESSGGKAMKRSERSIATNPPDRLVNVHQKRLVHQKRQVESSPGWGK